MSLDTDAATTESLEQLLGSASLVAAVPPDLDVTIELDAGDGMRWTATLARGTMQVAPGPAAKPNVRIFADPDTLAQVMGGAVSGVDAFLEGRLRTRGNLGLALRLGSILQPEGRPDHWPRWGRVDAGGLSTSYLEAGSGFPVILLHGLGATNASFLPTLSELSLDYRVIAPDLPGFGDSSKPFRTYHARFFGGWLIDFLDAMGIQRAHLIGNSMGGRVAIEGGLVAPERIDRLALLSPSPAFLRRRNLVRLVRMLRPELGAIPLFLSHRQVVRGIRGLFSRPSRLPIGWYEAAADEFLRVFASPWARVAFFSAAREIYLEEPHGENGFWDRLPALERPALFVWGDRDWLVPARFAKHVHNALPRAESVVLRDCGHVPQFELPEKTHALIREFFEAS
jgi:pimeloyl-ACP methyl ester carboxylesterase